MTITVLAMVTDCYGGYGGIAQYNRDFVSALDGWDAVARVEILPRVAPDPFVSPTGKLRQARAIHGRLRYSLRSLWAALRLRPQVIFCGHLYHGPLAMRLARLVGARMIVQVHGTEAWEALPPRLIAPLRAATRVLAVSSDTRARLIAQERALAATTAVLANTVDPQFTPGDRAAARASFGLDGEFVLLSVGRLDDRDGYKGHDRVIPLLRRLRETGRDVRYWIAGKGADRDRLERLCLAEGVSEHVRFLADVPGDRLPDLYRAADLFVLPSTGEGFGIVFLEAMACGTPALGLDVGGAADALCAGDLGLAVDEAAFPAALDAAIVRAETLDAGERAALSALIRETFGSAAFAARIRTVLEPLLD